MTTDELLRLTVLTDVARGTISARDAAETLGRSLRQVRRLLALFRAQGAQALAHGNRGRRPVHTLDPELVERVVALARSTYADLNDTHLSEVLACEEGIELSRSSVRRIRMEAGLVRPRRRRSPAHRERQPRAGMLVHLDALDHRWLEERGPRLVLVSAIDDATGAILAARFREREDAAGYLDLLYRIVSTVGRPEVVSHDRHGIFVRAVHSPANAGIEREPTQVGRALAALGIDSKSAPEARTRGPINGLFAMLQEQLCTELRTDGAFDLVAANRVLERVVPRFNAQFGQPALDPSPVFRSLATELDAWQVCCFSYVRTAARDSTIRFGEHRLQLLGDRICSSYARAKVEVREHLDGSLSVWYEGRAIANQAAPALTPRLRARSGRGTLPDVKHEITIVHQDDERIDWKQRRSPAAPVPMSASGPIPRRPGPGHPWRKRFKSDVTHSQNR